MSNLLNFFPLFIGMLVFGAGLMSLILVFITVTQVEWWERGDMNHWSECLKRMPEKEEPNHD